MSETTTFNGTAVRKGDTVKASLEGVVQSFNSGEIQVDIPGYGRTWVGETKFSKVEVTKKAGPPEPQERDAIVEATDPYGSTDRFVRRGSKWYYVDVYGDTTLKIAYTWTELLKMYDKVTVLGSTPTLPKDHTVRDLNFRQTYKRQYGDTITFNKGAASGGLDVANTYTMKKDEAIALAWDILKLYGQVQ